MWRRVLDTLPGWATADQPVPPPPTSVKLTPLAAVWHSGSPAAAKAERLLMLLEPGKLLVAK